MKFWSSEDVSGLEFVEDESSRWNGGGCCGGGGGGGRVEGEDEADVAEGTTGEEAEAEKEELRIFSITVVPPPPPLPPLWAGFEIWLWWTTWA